ncbi:MAG: alpha-glucan family phosphorylase, partial [Bacteroidales bacterium]|nr:alpha-glucan family phosphorylase [Bacteroidales bacterium]
MSENIKTPDYLFEVSWEICNKIGGIHTVISTKAPVLTEKFGGNYILIGPDVWKETDKHPEFVEDNSIFSIWKEKAESEGLRIRTGKWNVPGEPIAILVDFTPYFTEKDLIFGKLWEAYKLDSISGQWDYIEPALFGYAAGKVIESFYNFYLSATDKILTHFHEWMTGIGVLYLKEHVPQAGCIFTTHATVLGRSIAGNNLPLYDNLKSVDCQVLAKQFSVVAKYSLEKMAASYADAFTTVSEITAEECERFLDKKPDVITPNGFEDSFVFPNHEIESKRSGAKKRIKRIAEAVLNQHIDNDAVFLLTSGRYEFRNKGIDILIDALALLNKNEDLKKKLILFIAVPGNQAGPRKEISHMIESEVFEHNTSGKFLTHILYNKESDQVLQKLNAAGLHNTPDQKVQVVFIPAYLNGKDGIVNLEYYHFLSGFDLTVFPSYYEPWGYTPLESVAFGIPTITTSLAGFGRWVRDKFPQFNKAVHVVSRTDSGYQKEINILAKTIYDIVLNIHQDIEKTRNEGEEITREASWQKLITRYYESYDKALDEVEERYDLYGQKQSVESKIYLNGKREKPIWKKMFVQPGIPEKLQPLKTLSMNLWWSWNEDAVDLFESIDNELWAKYYHNPVSMLDALNFQHFEKLENDEGYMKKLRSVQRSYNSYMSAKSKDNKGGLIAYFSMEYGLHESLKTYSGGLGVLAGDYLKEVSDANVNLIAVGLLYRYGYFQQGVSLHGDQIAQLEPVDFNQLPVTPVMDSEGNWVSVSIALPGRNMKARAWKLEVGRVELYLLDTDLDENIQEDRTVTHQLYGGDWQNRFKQELLLGVGGIRLLETIDIHPQIYHLNEGHAAFAGLERLRNCTLGKRLSFTQALEVVRSSTLFTTHTPVPAGHDAFTEDILRTYIPHYAERLNISWNEFMNLGRWRENDPSGKFSMSVLAARLAQEMNGVSKIHGKISRKMFEGLYPGYFANEIHIGHVTNGVHFGTWAGNNWKKLYKKSFGKEFVKDKNNPDHWKNIFNISDKIIWEERQKSKTALVKYLHKKIDNDLNQREENPKVKMDTLEAIDEGALYIGFARRFATYKRAHLLFSDIERLKKIVNNPDFPVRFLFAGKAHPNDKPGQDLIKNIITISKDPEFRGRVIFLDNYDMFVAKNLVSGVDIWLNTPTRPLEASGTSGQKAVMNGVMNLSVLDGWWAEGYRENAGWAVEEAKTYVNQQFQDELDAETVYNLIEDEIIPLYFERAKEGIPHKWITHVKNTISDVAPEFLMGRMLNDYIEKYYNKLIARSVEINNDNFRMAREIAAWKQHILAAWDTIEIISQTIPDPTSKPLNLGDEFAAEII